MKIYSRQLPRGIGAVYLEGVGVVVNARLTSARRRAARAMLLGKPYAPFLYVRTADLAA